MIINSSALLTTPPLKTGFYSLPIRPSGCSHWMSGCKLCNIKANVHFEISLQVENAIASLFFCSSINLISLQYCLSIWSLSLQTYDFIKVSIMKYIVQSGLHCSFYALYGDRQDEKSTTFMTSSWPWNQLCKKNCHMWRSPVSLLCWCLGHPERKGRGSSQATLLQISEMYD